MAGSLLLRKEPTLIVFARKPLKGKVKRRLVKVIGCYRAMEVYRTLLMSTLRVGLSVGCPLPQLHASTSSRTLAL